jgi:hypothetical protein
MLTHKNNDRGFVPGGRGATMKEQGFDRRDFLKTAVVGGAAAAGGTTTIATPEMAQAQQPAASGDGRVRLSQS